MVVPIIPSFHHSNIPLLHYSILLSHCPLLQALVVCSTADPLSCLLVEEERDTTAEALVVFLHEPCVGVVVPHFESCDFNALLCLQPLHERFHFVAVGSFRSGEHQQVELLFRHWDSSFRVWEITTEGVSFFLRRNALKSNFAIGM